MSRILVTGVSGFIGDAVVRSLGMTDHQVLGIHWTNKPSQKALNNKDLTFSEVDLCDQGRMKEIMKLFQPDIVIHLAGSANPTKGDFFANNVLATSVLCDLCKNVKKFIFASSIVVYDEAGMSTGAMYEHDRVNPKSHYGASKLSCEYIARLPVHDIEQVCCMRLSATVGNVNKLTHGALKDLSEKILNSRGNYSKSVVAWGEAPGSNKPYIHVDDVVETIHKLISEEKMPEIINVCGKSPITIGTMIRTIEDCYNSKYGIAGYYDEADNSTNPEPVDIQYREINWGGEKMNNPGDNKILNANNSELMKLFYGKEFDSQDAIKKAVNQSIGVK